MKGVQPTRRARKKQQTRDTIERAALALFEQQGFHATTVAQIAQAADVAESTFFLHFPSKEDVVFAGHETEAEVLIDCLQASRGGTIEALVDYLRSAATRGQHDPATWGRRAAIISSTPALAQQERARWADHVRPVLTESFARDLSEPQPHLEARMLSAMTIAGMAELGRVEAEGEDVHRAGAHLLARLRLLYDAAHSDD